MNRSERLKLRITICKPVSKFIMIEFYYRKILLLSQGTRRLHFLYYFWGDAVAQLVVALCHKPEGHGFDSR
jgi:hypothetical protein